MKKHGPVLTLLAVALFMAGMFIVNMTKAKQASGCSAAYSAGYPVASGAPTSAVSTPASPTPTPAATTATASRPVASGFPPQVTYTG